MGDPLVDPEVVGLQPLKPIATRLQGLKPSQELLEFYRTKIAEYEHDQSELLSRLEKYKHSYEDRHKQEWELAQRENEIQQLQKALSDMQVYLFQEREHVLRLYAENDRLKIQELEDRKKIQRLINMGEGVEEETTYFKEPHEAHIVQPNRKVTRAVEEERRRRDQLQQSKRSMARGGDTQTREALAACQDRNETLVLTIEALKAQLEDQARVAKEQVAAMLEDRRVRQEETEVALKRSGEKLASLTSKLKQTQQLLYDSTRDFLDLKYEYRHSLRENEEEKERLLRRIEELKDDVDLYQAEAAAALRRSAVPPLQRDAHREDKDYREMGTNAYRYQQGFARAEQNTEKTAFERHQELVQDTLAEMYREQCIQLEDELCRLREQQEAAKAQQSHRSNSHLQKVTMWKKRYEALERRRALEVEGYKTDITMLRDKLKEMERQLYRLAVHLADGNVASEVHEQMLANVRKSAQRSRHLVGELQHLKGQVHAMEHRVHHLHDP